MPRTEFVILYLGSRLPSRSETFVYHELIALREHGVAVVAASVHEPEYSLGEFQLQQLADEAVPVYGRGAGKLIIDAATEFLRSPWRSARTLFRAGIDTVTASDCPLLRRPKIVWQALAALALANRVRSNGVTHIHAHMAHVPTTIAMYCAMQLRTGFSFTGHAADLFPQRTLLKTKLRRAQFVACISHWHRRFYQQLIPELPVVRLPIVRCGVRIIPNAGQLVSPPLVIAVGRLVPKKGFQTLIDAMAILRDQFPQKLDCWIVGDGPEREKLAVRIEQAGLTDSVQLVGAKSNLEIRTMLPQASLFVLPCQMDPGGGDRDGIPVALMEAMASGVCVITGRLEPIDELVRHHETGVLIEPGNAEELAAAMRMLLTDDRQRSLLAEQGKRWVQQEFSEDVNIDRLLIAFRACCVGFS